MPDEPVYPAPEKPVQYYCLFHPGMDCPVRDAIERETLTDKFNPVETGDKFMGVALNPLGRTFSKLMILAPFCSICSYKMSQDRRLNLR